MAEDASDPASDAYYALPEGDDVAALAKFLRKLNEFEPEHAGKMDFYLNVLNAKERAPGDNGSIGIILCAEKDEMEVEFSLLRKQNAIGVASYRLLNDLPKELRGKLPSAKELKEVLARAMASESIPSTVTKIKKSRTRA